MSKTIRAAAMSVIASLIIPLFMLSAPYAYAEENYDNYPYKVCTLKTLEKNLYYSTVDFGYVWDGEHETIPVLDKSRTVKRKHFIMSENEQLIIPAGKTLTLSAGATLKGAIYIEKGGELIVSDCSLDGAIVCDGKLRLSSGNFYSDRGALLYIGKEGSFTAASPLPDERIYIYTDRFADVVCLGTTNIEDPTFAAEPVAAVLCKCKGSEKSSKVITENLEDLLPEKIGYDHVLESPPYEYYTVYECCTMLFSGKSAVLFAAYHDLSNGWSYIGDMNINIFMNALDIYHNQPDD